MRSAVQRTVCDEIVTIYWIGLSTGARNSGLWPVV